MGFLIFCIAFFGTLVVCMGVAALSSIPSNRKFRKVVQDSAPVQQVLPGTNIVSSNEVIDTLERKVYERSEFGLQRDGEKKAILAGLDQRYTESVSTLLGWEFEEIILGQKDFRVYLFKEANAGEYYNGTFYVSTKKGVEKYVRPVNERSKRDVAKGLYTQVTGKNPWKVTKAQQAEMDLAKELEYYKRQVDRYKQRVRSNIWAY